MPCARVLVSAVGSGSPEMAVCPQVGEGLNSRVNHAVAERTQRLIIYFHRTIS